MSRFVSAGTAENPPERDDDWLKAQRELDETSRRKQEETSGLQEGGKSLYETLQANKAAKQEQFEESIRLKNQFRSLDEDEVDFLDSVLESTRAKDEAVRKETTEQLDLFRRQQEEAEKAARAEQTDEVAVEEEEQWHVAGRKRKKGKERDSMRGFKLRKSSSSAAAAEKTKDVKSPQRDNPPDEKRSPAISASPIVTVKDSASVIETEGQIKSSPSPKFAPAAGLGLGAYSSDED